MGNTASNILDGGLGVDTMSGGKGDDTYIVDNVIDQVIEASAEGIDTIKSNISWTLGANTENLFLTGSEAIDATGNTLNNILVGNSATNILDGGLGEATVLHSHHLCHVRDLKIKTAMQNARCILSCTLV